MNNKSVLDKFYIAVGKNVSEARKKKGMTQLRLANLLDYTSVSSVSNPEIYYNKTHFSLGQLYLISIILETDLKNLVKFDNHGAG